MKRVGNLYSKICEKSNIQKAINKASLRKKNRENVKKIIENQIFYIEKLNKTYVNNQTKLNATDFQQNVDKIDEVVTAVNNISSWEWIGTVGAGETKTIALTTGRMWLLALYNDYGNFGFYILNKATAGTQGIRI